MKPLLILGVAASVLIAAPAMAQGMCGCPGDATGDHNVGFEDVLQILADWGCMDCDQTDVDGNGVVGFSDILLVLANYGCGIEGEVTTISGTVANAITGDPIAGANVLVGQCPLVTNASGDYSGEFPVGQHTVSFEARNYVTEEREVILFPGFPTVLDVDLDPVAPVIVHIILGDAVPGEMIEATAVVEVLDGSTIQSYEWMQTGGAPAVIDDANSAMVSLDLASPKEYRDELMHILAEPPIGPEDLPEGIEFPEGEFPGGLQNRFHVVGVNPFALEEAGLVGLAVDVTTTSGTYAGVADLHTVLPWKPTAGIRSVSIGIPVLLYGKDQASYNWSLTRPAGSAATLADPTARNPEFTPDVPGLYIVRVFDIAAGANVDLQIFGGTWRGVIVGQDADGRPVPEATCLNCHIEGGVASDMFTPWIQTGHAEIFTDSLNTNDHWGEQCFSCHSVGYDPDVHAFGIDDQPDFLDFVSTLVGNPSPDNWTTMLADYPASAKLANVQCENCHGPQNGPEGVFSAAHTAVLPRVSLSSDVCATCHGEPLRHARFQQWQLSPHANYELAIDEGESGNCSRCHTANGFLAWLPILLGEVPGDPTSSIQVTWTSDETHPQTCVTCHDPHSIGTVSGEPNNATVRISGNTPRLIAGFTAYAVGRGAICMTCHNSRRGLRNDSVFDEFYGTNEASFAPHGSAQTDVLMGENAYLVETGNRGNHSFIADTCTNCHMVQTQPPPVLSYNQGGTNHTFIASRDICADCHGGGFTADSIQGSVQDVLDLLQATVEDGILAYMDTLIDMGNSIDLDGLYEVTDVADIADIEFGESRGQQAITVTLHDETVFGPIAMGNVEVLDNLGDPIGDFYDNADPGLIKAGWNWNLINNDGSRGVHNPSFALDALAAGIEAIDSGLIGAIQWPGWYTGASVVPLKEVARD